MNVFERIITREIPAQIVYEDDRSIAFRDINPMAPVHCVIVPKRCIDRVANAKAEDEALLGHLLYVAARVAEQEGIAESGYRLVVNNGQDGGQTVFHIHVHLLGGRPMQWPPG